MLLPNAARVKEPAVTMRRVKPIRNNIEWLHHDGNRSPNTHAMISCDGRSDADIGKIQTEHGTKLSTYHAACKWPRSRATKCMRPHGSFQIVAVLRSTA